MANEKCETCRMKIYDISCGGCVDACKCRKCYSPPTNADRIRAMSDEELAEFICSKLRGCYMTTCPGEKLCNSTDGKANGLKKWLQQPVEVDNG